MEIQELVEKFMNNPKTEESYQEVIKWCGENIKNFDLKEKNQIYLYERATRYLMKYKIGKWNKDDANIIITYLSKKFAYQQGIDENVTVKILDEDEYKHTYGDKSSAICVNNDNTSEIAYSPVVVNNLLSNDSEKILRGMQIIYHEVVHAMQNNVIKNKEINGITIPKTKSIYFMALETIARKYKPGFYEINYSQLLKENHAEKIGLKMALKTMEEYNPKLYKLYNQDVRAQRLENYDKNFYDAKSIVMKNRGKDFMEEIDDFRFFILKKIRK